jgi:hypothetical protein
MAKRGWDLTSKRSMDAAAEWMRKNADALLVLVVRPEDFAFAVDGQIAPSAAADMVSSILDPMREQLAAERETARAAALEKAARRKVKEFGVQ